MRLVVFGGSFDPVHLGHEAIADAARAELRPQRLLWVPAGRAPHKDAGAVASDEQRVGLLRLVLARRAADELDLRELRRDGPSYSVDTLRELHAEQPGADLIFLLGADSLAHLASWRDPAALFALARFAFAPRPGWDRSRLDAFRAALPRAHADAFQALWLDMPEVAVSSTAIRAALARGAAPEGLRPEVLAEIRRLGCYA